MLSTLKSGWRDKKGSLGCKGGKQREIVFGKDGVVRENNGSGGAQQPETEVAGREEMYYPIKVHVSDAQPSI